MIKNLKTSHITAMEALNNCSSNPDLELIGTAPLKDHSLILKQAVESNTLNDNFTFKNIFGFNTPFFYIIESISNEAVNFFERGVGYIYEQNNKIYLKRQIPLVSGKNRLELNPVQDGIPFPFRCCDNDCKSIIYSTIPPSYIECLPTDNCVITSSLPLLPQPLRVDNNSFLGRFDNDLESVSFEDVRLVDKITNLITKFTKQLKLKTSKLSSKRLESEVIDLVPQTNPKAKKGSMYYDESDETIKVYNGQSWKTIAFLEE